MKEILLTQGKVALVDDEDFEKVNQFKWCASLSTNNRWYAQRGVRTDDGKWTSQWMHRFIMGLEHGDPREVDHKDREATLDNRKNNLRVTLDQNQQNVGRRKDNVSGFKGVTWHKRDEKWRAQISLKGKLKSLGYFPTPELAALAYDAAAIEHYGEFAVTNMMLEAA